MISSDFNFFFFNDTATTEIYPLSLHDALPISMNLVGAIGEPQRAGVCPGSGQVEIVADAGPAVRLNRAVEDRKSTRLNSSHANISYAVFCLKKKKTTT